MNKLTHLSALLLCFIVFGFNSANAQNIGINATGAAPDAGAMLDISATNKGLLIPRISIPNLSSISPIVGSTTTSMLVYNTNVTTGLGYYYWDGTRWVNLSADANAWKITGNAGTTPGTNFLGTSDAQHLVFRTNNIERMRVLSNGRVGIGTTTPSELLHVSGGNFRLDGAFMPNGNAGTTDKMLLSKGPGNAPAWSNFTFLNNAATTAFGKFYSGVFNLPGGTLVLTLSDPDCRPESTCTFAWTGNLSGVPDYTQIFVSIEARTGQWIFRIRNNTGYILTNMQFSYFAAY